MVKNGFALLARALIIGRAFPLGLLQYLSKSS